MRVLVAYDCLYPWTVGGAERWYRRLAERLAADGHEVTYATRRQWDRGDEPRLDGVRVLTVAPRMGLYTADGRRRIDEALAYGAGLAAHLARDGARYDVVHTASFPYFSLLAAGVLRRPRRFRLIVDWHEVWTADYWKAYLGRLGPAGDAVQAACLRMPQRAFCFSRLTARRLEERGLNGRVTVLEGQWEGPLHAGVVRPAGPSVVSAGRLIPEKQAEALPAAVRWARDRAGDLRVDVFGEGPARPALEAALGADGVGALHGFVDADQLEEAVAQALCMVLASRREGYGKVVVEAARLGVPSVVVAGPDNAAVELVSDGVNGFVAPSAAPADLGAALVRVHEAGPALRESTARWFDRNAQRLSLGRSLDVLLEAYRT